MAELVQTAGSVLIVAAAVMALACVAAYALGARWWTSTAGRHLFSFTSVLAGGLTLWSARLIGSPSFSEPSPDAWPYVRLVAFAAFFWVLTWRLILIIRAQYVERRDKRDENRETS